MLYLVHVEVAKGKLDVAVREKDAAAEAEAEAEAKECAKIRKDYEQKDKILGAVLRKSKLDATEKQVLLNEVKLLRVKKRQVEGEMGRWRKMWESKHRHGVGLSELQGRQAGSAKEAGLEHAGVGLPELQGRQARSAEEAREEREAMGGVDEVGWRQHLTTIRLRLVKKKIVRRTDECGEEKGYASRRADGCGEEKVMHCAN